MRYYIAYKYSNNKNKEDLKTKLEKLDRMLKEWGIDCFILGRDIKKWKHIHFGSLTLIPVIFKNMKKCEHVLAYIDSSSFSKGLFFEVVISKILGKESVQIREVGHGSKFFKYFFHKTFYVNNMDEIKREMLPK